MEKRQMKNLFWAIMFLSIMPMSAKAIGTYKAGDKLYVWAKSGLTVREKADVKSSKKTWLKFGSLVTVQAEGLKKTAFETIEFKGFKIKGYWVKIKSGNTEGWVFDGYLSSLKVPTPTEPKGMSADRDILDAYYSNTSKRKGGRKELKKSSGDYDYYEQLYEDGSKLTVRYYEGGSQRIMLFRKGITTEEAYLFGKAFWLSDAKGIKETYNAKADSIEVNTDDTLSTPLAMNIVWVGERIEVSFELAD